ncbi:hypothetical protein [Streptomyces sp. PTY087I2]|uniref:hypothetical protein n=1 Tax=Streptomyces sp. PTY087I2 TaxID=1819298 RepID=UPI00114CE9AD|nr:hypothetical protein [Streptomyces sp. PTY087I2]
MPKQAVNYDLGNTDWVKEDLVTLNQHDTRYVTVLGGFNWYLTAKENAEGRDFCHFAVSNTVTTNQYDGFYGWLIQPTTIHPQGSLMRSAYVWYQEPHDVKYPENGYAANSGSANPGGGVSAVILKMPNGNKWWDAAKIYERSSDANSRSLCVTCVTALTGGDGWVQGQPNPLQSGTPFHNGPDAHNYYNPSIVAYDQYGNSGTFYLDGYEAVGVGKMVPFVGGSDVKLYTSPPSAPH